MHRFLIFILLITLAVCNPLNSSAQNLDAYKKEVFIKDNDSLPYRILLPKNFDSNKRYPLILFLHGSGERGSDNELQLTHGADLFLKEQIRNTYEAIVVFPQCPSNWLWTNVRYGRDGYKEVNNFPSEINYNFPLNMVEGLINSLKETYKLDLNRLYVGGLSIGGMGTFELVHRNPNLFAAAFPICGGSNPKIAEEIKNTSLWIFHGDSDNVVPSSLSINMYKALKALNADVKLTIYPGVGHDSWTNTFAEPDLLKWLFSKSK